MIRIVRIALTVLAAGAALVTLVIAAIPVWLLLRVPGAILPPEAGPGSR